MGHLLYLMFRYDGDVMENLDFGGIFGASKHTQCGIKDYAELCSDYVQAENGR